MSKPRVLKVVRPAEGGIRVHVKNLLENLRDEFDFTVACPVEMAGELDMPGIKTVAVPLGKSLDIPADLKTFWRLLYLCTGGLELVHAHGFKAGLVARPAARLARIPCLVTIHADFMGARCWQLRRFYLEAEKQLSRWTARYITVSEWLAGELGQALGLLRHRVSVIPNGVTREVGGVRARLPFKDGVPLVGVVARLAPQKGIEHFIHAAAALTRLHPEVRFVVVGDGPLRVELEELAVRLGLSGVLHFTGYRQDVPAILRCLSVYVQPSLSEGQGIAVLEAMAAGCPVVVTAVGGMCELVRHGETGLLVRPGDAKSMATAIASLLDNRLFAGRLAGAAYQEAGRFDLQNMIAKTRALYLEVIRSA